jgi:hypothetical protein
MGKGKDAKKKAAKKKTKGSGDIQKLDKVKN